MPFLANKSLSSCVIMMYNKFIGFLNLPKNTDIFRHSKLLAHNINRESKKNT